MPFRVELGEDFLVSRDGICLGRPPDQALGVLLLGLLHLEGNWESRSTIGKLLYPESESATALNALRHTLFRLRKWLGSDPVGSQRGAIRICGSEFEVRWPHGEFQRLAPLLHHPWADSIRQLRLPTASAMLPDPLQDFIKAVDSAALVDKTAARGILVGGSTLLGNLDANETARLLTLTQPANQEEPYALEHLERRVWLNYITREYQVALKLNGTLFRLARRQGCRDKMASAADFAMYLSIESGDMAGAQDWLGQFLTLSGARRAVDRARSQAMFLWNMNRPKEASELIKSTIPLVANSGPATQYRYWHNAAMLWAETEEIELAWRAVEATDGIAPSFKMQGHKGAMSLARASIALGAKDLSLAKDSLATLVRHLDAPVHRVGQLYAAEAYAEALAKSGELRDAAKVWGNVEAMRRESGIKAPPRVLARKARVLRLTSR